jgi:hypothetical protein
MYAASAIAANTITRSLCAASAPLWVNQMFSAMGVGGGGSLIGGLAAVLALIPFVFYKYGKPIRVRSRFAPTKDTTARKERDEEKDVPDQAAQNGRSSSDGVLDGPERHADGSSDDTGLPRSDR